MHCVIAFMQWHTSLTVVPNPGSYSSTAIFRVVVLHTITLWVVTHSIIHTASFCVSTCILCMNSSLAGTGLLSCAAQCCTMYRPHSVPRISTLLPSYFEKSDVMNTVPACMTLVLCSYSYCIHYANGRAMVYLSGGSLPCQCSIQVMHYDLNSCSGCGYINIYTTPYTITWWWVAILHLLLSTWTTCGSMLSCHFSTRSSSASRQCCEVYMQKLLNITCIMLYHMAMVISLCIARKILLFPPCGLPKKNSTFVPLWYHCKHL